MTLFTNAHALPTVKNLSTFSNELDENIYTTINNAS
jgi:hypothetical protein